MVYGIALPTWLTKQILSSHLSQRQGPRGGDLRSQQEAHRGGVPVHQRQRERCAFKGVLENKDDLNICDLHDV